MSDSMRVGVTELYEKVVQRMSELDAIQNHEGHIQEDRHGYPHPLVCVTCSTDEREIDFVIFPDADVEMSKLMHDELEEIATSLKKILQR